MIGVVAWLATQGAQATEDLRRRIDYAGLRAEAVVHGPPQRAQATEEQSTGEPTDAAMPVDGHGADSHGADGHGDSADGATDEPGEIPLAAAAGTEPDASPPDVAPHDASPSDIAPPEAGVREPLADVLPDLIETAAIGPLPRIAPDGRRPWQAYAKPHDPFDGRPRIAIVVGDLGLSTSATETAVETLPAAVTLAFSPYAGRLDDWLRRSRNRGHEVLLTVPMEPLTYPQDDPGPQTLLVAAGPERNRRRLEWLMSRAGGYVGLMNVMGERFVASRQALEPVLTEIDRRGLMFFDANGQQRSAVTPVATEMDLPIAVSDRSIDAIVSRDAIDLRLRELEEIARDRGLAVGYAAPYPITLERLADWAVSLAPRGFVLAPITAAARIQADR